MPLDGHGHLVKQGWSGKGTGLRNGAIAKPITVIQKKTLAGIGKDRDEAFPFWDHVFQAAAASIQFKLHDSDDESNSGSDDEGSSTPALELKRTTTGIISNRRPLSGTPALSGATTPSSGSSSASVTPQLSLMAVAKQQAARRMLYAAFYRGPVLAADEEKDEAPSPADSQSRAGPSTSSSSTEKKEREKSKKRKADENEEKQERKRRKREAKARAKDEERKTDKGKERAAEASDESEDKEARAARKAAKAARRQQKAEKRALKEERRKKRAARKACSQESADAPSRDTEEAGVDEAIPMAVNDAADTREAAPTKERRTKKAKAKASTADASSSDKKTKKTAKS